MIYNKNKYIYDVKLERSIAFICKNQYRYFLNKQNVVGVGCGYKVKNGFKTSILCLQIFVARKVSKFSLCRNQLIPKYYKGILTDVIKTGKIFGCSLKNRIRPVQGGYGISPDNDNYYGSLGCVVSNGINNFLLSANHTLTDEGQYSIGKPIVQPAKRYGGFHPNDTIGTLNKFIPLRPIEGERQPINVTDCALALLTSPDIVTPKIALIGSLKGVKKSVKLNDEVKKVGATSELTTGTVTSIHAEAVINLKSQRRFLFEDLIVTSSMANPGDSGAILVNKNNYGVGMIFALNDTMAVSCYLNTVLDQLDVHLVT